MSKRAVPQMRLALLKSGLRFLEEPVLTPRGKDLEPGTWTRRSLGPWHWEVNYRIRQLRIHQ